MRDLNQLMADLACTTVDVGRHQVVKVVDIVEFFGASAALGLHNV